MKWALFGDYNLLGMKFDQKLKYKNIFFITLFHVLAVYCFFTHPWITKWKLTVFWFLYASMAGFGVTAGVHRCFTHKSFKVTTFAKLLLLICYAAAGHNKLYDWVRDHRIHHKFSETDADPHNAKRGFFFAHVGWLMLEKHPEVIKKGKTVDMSDITGDPMLVWFDKHFQTMKLFFCFIFPILISRYLIGESWYYSVTSHTFIRYIILLNCTWLVNSAAHLYGWRPYDTRINPTDNILTSILAYGEAYHNYHHTFPWDYKASEIGKYNPTTHFLDVLAMLGLIYDLKSSSPDDVQKYILKYGDGSHTNFKKYVDKSCQAF